MSSGDELGGYNPVTPGPVQAQKRPAPRPAPRPVPRAVAGPSKSQKTAPPKKTAQKDVVTIVVDQDPEVTMISSDEDEAPTRKATAANKGKGKGSQTAVAQTNGAATAKARGKMKPPAAPQPSSDAMDVDAVDAVESDPVPAVARPTKRTNPPKTSPTADVQAAIKRDKREIESLKRENERLRKRLEDTNIHSSKLSEQLESLMKVRQTEPEGLLAERIAQYEATTRAQELLIHEQTEQLAQLKVLADSGRLHSVPFLSREQADAEMRGLENKIKTLSEAVKRKDAEIAELKTENGAVQTQLEQEIKMAKSQRSNRLDPVGASKPDPKQNDVVELYERLTNFIVISVKRGKFRLFGLPETTFRCIYTHIDDPLGEPSPEDDDHISFDLVDTWARKDTAESDEIVSQDELEPKTMYIPLDLQMHKPEVLQRLDFFTEQFLFTPAQMNVFLRTLADRLNKNATPDSPQESAADQLQENQSSEKDDDIMEVLVNQ